MGDGTKDTIFPAREVVGEILDGISPEVRETHAVEVRVRNWMLTNPPMRVTIRVRTKGRRGGQSSAPLGVS